jgi:uncharacterized protein
MVSLPIGRVLSRHAERAIREALDDTRVVLVNGARQSGQKHAAASVRPRRLDRAA